MKQFICLLYFALITVFSLNAADFLLYVSGNNSLSPDAELLWQTIADHPISSPNRVIAQVKTQTGNHFCVRGAGSNYTETLTDQDYGIPATLAGFLDKAEQYRTGSITTLVMWGHGTSWYPENSIGSITPEISFAIGRDGLLGNALFFDAETERSVFTHTYDVIFTDACHYAAAETIYAFRNAADYYIGSGHLVPSDAFDYSTLFTGTYTSVSTLIDAVFDAYVNKNSEYSLSAVNISDFCTAMNDYISATDFSSLDRSSLLGMTDTDSYTSLVNDIDLKAFFSSPSWLVKNITSDSRVIGISLFFPFDYGYVKEYFSDYRMLSFNNDTAWLKELSTFFGKDEVAPIIDSEPRLQRYANTLRVTSGTWYDTGLVSAELYGVPSETRANLTPVITNNSGLASLHGGIVTINTSDSVQFNHGAWSTDGFLQFEFAFLMRAADILVVSIDTGTGFQEYGRWRGNGTGSVWLSNTIQRVLFTIEGTFTPPAYRGVDITVFRSYHFDADIQSISEGISTIADFFYNTYYMTFTDDAGNCTVLPLSADSTDKEKVLYWPNPTYDGIVHLGKSYPVIEVFTPAGKKVRTFTNTDTISLKTLSHGLYFVKLGNKVIKVIYL